MAALRNIVSFSDYMTLHSSLILLPADDESCEGAILSIDFSPQPDSDFTPSPSKYVIRSGSVLLSITPSQSESSDVKSLPFDKILAMARDAKYPIKLTFGPSEDAYSDSQSDAQCVQDDQASPPVVQAHDLGRRASELGNAFGSTFSRWGKALNTQRRASVGLKNPAMTTPVASSSTPSSPLNPLQSPPPPESSHTHVIYVQSGADSPLVPCSPLTSLPPSSTLTVRSSPPIPNCAYQWKVDGRNLPGCTTQTYRVNTCDCGRTITAVITPPKGPPHHVTVKPRPTVTRSSFLSCLTSLTSSSGVSVHDVGGRGSLTNRVFRVRLTLGFSTPPASPRLTLHERVAPTSSPTKDSATRGRWNSVSTSDDVKNSDFQMSSAIDMLDDVAREEVRGLSGGGHQREGGSSKGAMRSTRAQKSLVFLTTKLHPPLFRSSQDATPEGGLTVVSCRADAAHPRNVEVYVGGKSELER